MFAGRPRCVLLGGARLLSCDDLSTLALCELHDEALASALARHCCCLVVSAELTLPRDALDAPSLERVCFAVPQRALLLDGASSHLLGDALHGGGDSVLHVCAVAPACASGARAFSARTAAGGRAGSARGVGVGERGLSLVRQAFFCRASASSDRVTRALAAGLGEQARLCLAVAEAAGAGLAALRCRAFFVLDGPLAVTCAACDEARIEGSEPFAQMRRTLALVLGLPAGRPVLRPGAAVVLTDEAWLSLGSVCSEARRTSATQGAALAALSREGDARPLLCVHEGLTAPDFAGTTHVVSGAYGYYHYGMQGERDTGWGCAYRSLQTIASWLLLAGFAGPPVPSLRAIQSALVETGDREPAFVGSREWIGSLEVGNALTQLYGVSYRIIQLASGADFAGVGPELAAHFDRTGAPVMIGGGVLAYTLLGVHYSAEGGGVRFLILDPHYTGLDAVDTVQRKGFVAWRPVELFDAGAFYNLCLPQLP